MRSSPKESVPDLSNMIVIWDVIVVLCFYTHTVFIGVLSDEPGYKFSLVTMSAQTCTGKRCFPVCHWVTVAFLTPFFCILNVGDIFSARCRRLMMYRSLRRFLYNLMFPFRSIAPLWGFWNTCMIAC